MAVGAVGGRRRPNRRCPRLSGGSVAAGLRIEHPAITNGLQRPAAAAAQWLPRSGCQRTLSLSSSMLPSVRFTLRVEKFTLTEVACPELRITEFWS
ncbi:hypothetical protein I5U14_12380 [Stenotrophomonas maltophilia]|nr:hypothetical protein [Stenotrophomonas maltophilia]